MQWRWICGHFDQDFDNKSSKPYQEQQNLKPLRKTNKLRRKKKTLKKNIRTLPLLLLGEKTTAKKINTAKQQNNDKKKTTEKKTHTEKIHQEKPTEKQTTEKRPTRNNNHLKKHEKPPPPHKKKTIEKNNHREKKNIEKKKVRRDVWQFFSFRSSWWMCALPWFGVVASAYKLCTLEYESTGRQLTRLASRDPQNPQRNPPTCTMVSNVQQGNLPVEPRGIGERGKSVGDCHVGREGTDAIAPNSGSANSWRDNPSAGLLLLSIHSTHCNAIMAIVASAKSLISSGVHASLMMVVTDASLSANKIMSWPAKLSAVSYCRWEAKSFSSNTLCFAWQPFRERILVEIQCTSQYRCVRVHRCIFIPIVAMCQAQLKHRCTQCQAVFAVVQQSRLKNFRQNMGICKSAVTGFECPNSSSCNVATGGPLRATTMLGCVSGWEWLRIQSWLNHDLYFFDWRGFRCEAYASFRKYQVRRNNTTSTDAPEHQQRKAACAQLRYQYVLLWLDPKWPSHRRTHSPIRKSFDQQQPPRAFANDWKRQLQTWDQTPNCRVSGISSNCDLGHAPRCMKISRPQDDTGISGMHQRQVHDRDGAFHLFCFVSTFEVLALQNRCRFCNPMEPGKPMACARSSASQRRHCVPPHRRLRSSYLCQWCA